MRATKRRGHGSAFAVLLLSACWADADQPSTNPALEACQRFATRQYQQASPERFVAVRLLEEGVNAESYSEKVGSQSVATVLSGRGIWQEKSGGPSNVRFTCLLENPEKPLFVALAKDGPRDPADVCWDGFEPAEWGKLVQCLRDSLERTEAALEDSLKQAAKQAEESLDKASAKRTLRESNAQWIKYRDSECARRQAFVLGRNHPDIGELTCMIHKTAERIADMHFDE